FRRVLFRSSHHSCKRLSRVKISATFQCQTRGSRVHVFVIEKLTEFSFPASHVILWNKHPSIIKGFEQPWRRRGYNRDSTRKSLYTYHSPALIRRWNEKHFRTCPYALPHCRFI